MRARVPMILLALVFTPAVGLLGQQPDTGATPGALKKLTLEQLMNLEVTSVSKRPEKLSEAPAAIQVITAEDIQRSGATSLPEALRLASNLEVAQLDSRQWAISARGFNSTTANKLLVLIDGRTVYTPLYSGVFWDVQTVPLWDVDRIEVISGPGATLWGANAVNGVINVILKSSRDTHGAYLAGGGGTELRGFGGARYGGAAGAGVHYRVYGLGFDRGQSALPSGQGAADDWHLEQGGGRLDWDVSKRTQVTLESDVYDGRIAQAAAPDIAVSGGNAVGTWSHMLSATSNARLQVYYDRTHRDIPATFAEDLDTYDVDFQHRLAPARGHDLVWGAGWRLINDAVTNSASLAFLPPHVRRDWFTGFLQDEIAVAPDRVRLTIGTKLEHNEYTGVEVQPSARVSWTPSGGRMLWAAFSRAVRTPSRIDREFYAPGQPPYLLAGGPDFQSERLLAAELGCRAQPLEGVSVSLSTFYDHYDDLRSIEQVNPPSAFPVVIGNGNKGKTYGAELTADYRVTERWRLWLGYTEMRVALAAKPGSTDTTQGRSEAADPDRHLLVRNSLDLPGGIVLEADARYVGEVTVQQVPAYGELDVRLGWHPVAGIELSFIGQNLLHASHAEFGAAATRREVQRGVVGRLAWHF